MIHSSPNLPCEYIYIYLNILISSWKPQFDETFCPLEGGEILNSPMLPGFHSEACWK